MQKIKITTSGYTSSCRIDGQTMETVINFIFLGSENHCGWWLQPWNLKTLVPWKDWGQEKGTTEDEMIGWHHQLNGHGFGWTPGVGDGQGGLACCGSWDHKESDMTEWLNWTVLWKKTYGKPRQHIKKQRHCFADRGAYIQSYGFSSSHVWM